MHFMIGRWWKTLTEKLGLKSRSEPRSLNLDDADSKITANQLGLCVASFGKVSICGNFREHNEDNLFTPDASYTGLTPIYIVADGMGGQHGGEHASRIAVDVVPHEFARRFRDETKSRALTSALTEAIVMANQEIIAFSKIQPQYSSMGTTLTAVSVNQGKAFVVGVGDSRCYRIRAGRVEQLTRDHSMAQALADVGTIRQDEVASHRYNHVLYRYLGGRDLPSEMPEIKIFAMLEGDRFVICSDGLSGVVSDKEMVNILKDEPDAQLAAQKLVDLAVENRSRDNITCIVLNIGRAENSSS